MKKQIRRCFDCIHIQPHRSGDHFDTICDKTGKPTDPSAVCDDFERPTAVKKKSPHAVKDKASYAIKSQSLRRIFRGVPSFSLTPRSEGEELIAAGFLDRIVKDINDYARKVARKSVDEIGRKD